MPEKIPTGGLSDQIVDLGTDLRQDADPQPGAFQRNAADSVDFGIVADGRLIGHIGRVAGAPQDAIFARESS